MPTLYLQAAHHQQIQAQLTAELPNEACGLLGGLDDRSLQVFPITNELHSPTRYRMAPAEQLAAMLAIEEENNWDLLAIYHSHPNGPAVPSITDIQQAYYPEVIYLIYSPVNEGWQCRAFIIDKKQVREIDLEIT